MQKTRDFQGFAGNHRGLRLGALSKNDIAHWFESVFEATFCLAELNS